MNGTKVEQFKRILSQIIYKPGSVIEDVIYLGLNSHSSSSGSPRRLTKDSFLYLNTASSLFDLAPSGVCHAFFVTKKPVSSYLTVSPLPWLGGLFSVALSLKSPSPVVNWHCVFTEPGLSSVKKINSDNPII